MADQYKNMMIALFICAAAGIITFILLFIHPTVGDERKMLWIYFSDIDKVNVGTRVTYGGKAVGEVVAIHPLEGEKDHRLVRNGQVYLYAVELRVDSGVHIFSSDEVTLRTSGLLGEKSVAIIPQPPAEGVPLRDIEHEKIYAKETRSVEETLNEFKKIATKIEQVLDNVNRIVEQLDSDGTFHNIAHIASNVSDISMALNHPEQLSDIIGNIHTLSHRAVGSWDTVNIALADIAHTASNAKMISSAINQPERLHGIVDNTYQLSHNLCVASPKLDAIIDEIYRGEGTVGKLVMGDELYLRVTSLLNKGEVIANDINHYGLLFNLDKGWQRLRARRMNLLARLSTPQEFRNYFNDEIDQITTSLSRVEMIVERNSSLYPCGLLLDDNEFAKVYAGLLRRVEGMEEALKMYNQQLVDQQLPTTELVPITCPLLPTRG